MKKIFYILFIMLFTSFFSFASAKVNIAYINADKVFNNFSTWNNFVKKIEQHSIKVRDIVTKKEKDIEEKSIVGAGSVITKNVKKKSLALTRSSQTEIKNYKRK